MAQDFKVDIFSEDIDVDAVSAKRSTLSSSLINDSINFSNDIQPTGLLIPNIVQLRSENQGLWKTKTIGPLKKTKTKPAKAQKLQPIVLKPKTAIWKPTPADWKPIPAIGAETSVKKIGKKPVANINMDRPNLKVVEETAGSIKINLDKTKEPKVQEVNPSTKPKEKTEEPKAQKDPPKVAPAVSSPTNKQQDKPQGSGAKGRMPASAFMNIDQQKTRAPKTPTQPQPNWSAAPNQPTHPAYFSYPKGIPKSYFSKAYIEQLHSQVQFADSKAVINLPPTPTTGPVWEAKIPTIKSSEPVWTTNKYDQPPISQYTPTPSQVIAQDGQYTPSEYVPDQAFDQMREVYGERIYGEGKPFQEDPFARSSQMYGQPDSHIEEIKSQYSPSDAYADMVIPESNDEIRAESPDSHRSGSKRLSAFQRLGPVTHPKKPKLTINLLVGKEEAVREVVDESEDPLMDKYTPVLERSDIQTSLDDTIMKFLAFWPWKKSVSVRRTYTARESKNVMQAELEQMEEHYDKDKMFFGILVQRYPESWRKEDVMDAVLEALKGKSLIPCFVEFTKHECKFLVIRSKPALTAIHKMGFIYRKDDVDLKLSILHMNLSVNQIDFIPRLILRKRLSMSMDGEAELNLKQFTLAPDISHFLYFPLSRGTNQLELMQLQSSVPWHLLTKLVLSHNKLTSLSGFDLTNHTPKLKHLDISFNRLESITSLFTLRELPLNYLMLEGNPLCADYIEPERYMKVLKLLFSGLREIDGVKLPLPGDFPPYKRNYSPLDAAEVASKLLETLFPLLDADPEERQLCEDLYMDDAVMTITFMYKLRYGPIYKDYRALFSRARIMDEGEMDAIEGAPAIAKIIHRWPKLQHDPLTFTVDVLYHTDTTTMLRVSGIMKVTAETLAEDEHLLHFTRTIVLHTLDSREYKITNEMIYWDLPDKKCAMEAFRMTTVKSKNLNLKLDSPPDAELKEKLLEIFMAITNLGREPSERCLKDKNWHLRNALEYFAKLLKLDNLEILLC